MLRRSDPGVAIDTSFGMSPQSGLPQGRSVGDIDAFAVLFMMKRLGIGVDEWPPFWPAIQDLRAQRHEW